MENFVDTLKGRDLEQEMFETFNRELALELLSETDATDEEKELVIAQCDNPYDAKAIFHFMRLSK